MKKGTGLVPVFLMLLVVGCGKKGPPLPPLVRLPASPSEFGATRRGSTVAIQFTVPSANMDGARPADVARVEVFALTGPPTVTPEEVVKRGKRVGSVPVKPPADPDEPADQEQRPPRPAAPGELDQGAVAHLSETIEPVANAADTDVRSYVGVGISPRGRRGAYSTPAVVPIGEPPAAPGTPTVEYDETGITVTWPLSADVPTGPATYQVYGSKEGDMQLTEQPIEENQFIDHRMDWGAERCYVIRTVEKLEGFSVESDGSTATCVTLADTFAPATPVGLQAIAADGAVNLIWDPNNEGDLAGYHVWRAVAPETAPARITSSLIVETTFKDAAPAGARVVYAVQAVDKAGNASPLSESVEETAR